MHPPELIVRSENPLNCETPLPLLGRGLITPTEHFYIRSHFPVPEVDAAGWRLQVRGLVRHPLTLSLDELKTLPAQTLTVTLECAGNGRSGLDPKVDGEQWDLGAASTAEWTGVPLADILDRADIDARAIALVFTAADGATDAPVGDARRFDRSLTLAEARSTPVLLAYAMNGAQLSPDHGYPLRVIVPGWYAVSGVKWLTHIDAIDHVFSGHFQTHKYVYEHEHDGRTEREPIQHLRVRSLITHPSDGSAVPAGALTIRGRAWSGHAPVVRVDVSLEGEWREARMLDAPSRFCWQRWELITNTQRPGDLQILSRATDGGGNVQPAQPDWNRLGYGNNVIQSVTVRVA